MKLPFFLFIGLALMFNMVIFIDDIWAYSDPHSNHAYHAEQEDIWSLSPEYNSSQNSTAYTTNTLITPALAELHEIYFRLEYKDGYLPNNNDFIGAMSSEGHTVPAHNFQLGIQGQHLIASCALIQDYIDFIDAGHTWTIIVQGNEPLKAIRAVATYRKNTTNSMPDYEGNQDVDLHTICAEDVLSEISCTSIDEDALQVLTSSKKIIVLIHGWNPHEKLNSYGPEYETLCFRPTENTSDNEDDDRNSFAFGHLMVNLMSNPAVENKWAVTRYNWNNDAMTGPILDLNGLHITNPNASRDAAHIHGKKLGELLVELGVEKVHFIAHSAGNWVARRAAEYLNIYGNDCTIQVTSLDPFVNDDDGTGEDNDDFDLEPDFELMPNFVDRLDNYYAIDNQVGKGSDWINGWTSGDFDGWINLNIENLDSTTCYLPFMDDHAGPIYWYAMSSNTEGSESLKSLGYGFYYSLAWQEYLIPTITINSPTTNSIYSTTNNLITISGTASDDVGVYQVMWSNNRGGSGFCSGTTSWVINDIILYEGENIITITVEDAAENTSSVSLAVTYTPIPAVNPAPWLSLLLLNSTPDSPPIVDCGAYVAPGVWKEFDCYNLAAIGRTTNDDPFTPSWRLIGGYWQWGRKGPDSNQWYNTNTENFAHGPTGPSSEDANEGAISGWDATYAHSSSWYDNYKTGNDPCPAGFRVPTITQWNGVRVNNTQSIIGSWSGSATNYSSARLFGDNLMLPAAGARNYSDGSLIGRGREGHYWSSTSSGTNYPYNLFFFSNSASTNTGFYGIGGTSIRCIAE